MSNHNSSGLLRFRSAPTSVLSMDKLCDSNDGPTSRIGGGGGGGGGGACFEDSAAVDGAYRVQTPMGSSSLLRQNSSPAGLFSRITSSIGEYSPGNYRVSSGDPLSSSRGRHLNYAYPSLGLLSRISENETEEAVELDAAPTVANGNGSSRGFYASSLYPFGSWDHDPSEALAGLKREVDNTGQLFAAGAQNGEIYNRLPMTLSRHLSLPKTSAAMDRLLQFQDSVPCKIRAKRGCATHPRSIAERVRRTRISERMRKLQELVPHMDKQTNTADMLDLAVDYIKDLQKQYKTLSDTRANCRCSAGQKPVGNYQSA